MDFPTKCRSVAYVPFSAHSSTAQTGRRLPCALGTPGYLACPEILGVSLCFQQAFGITVAETQKVER